MIPPSNEGECRNLLKYYLDYCEAIYLNHKENRKQILEKVQKKQTCIDNNYQKEKDGLL